MVANENPVEWVEKYGDYLFAFAFSRLHNETAAEDLVQETLLAAFQSRQKFSHHASEKTWLTAILKHKIIDYYRRKSHQISFDSDETEANFFDESGNWRESPAVWNATPEILLERKEFQAVLQESLAHLPPNLCAVFTLREIEGLTTNEICEILKLSPNNFWVLLHRARLKLRQAIECRWFENKTKSVRQSREITFSTNPI